MLLYIQCVFYSKDDINWSTLWPGGPGAPGLPSSPGRPSNPDAPLSPWSHRGLWLENYFHFWPRSCQALCISSHWKSAAHETESRGIKYMGQLSRWTLISNLLSRCSSLSWVTLEIYNIKCIRCERDVNEEMCKWFVYFQKSSYEKWSKRSSQKK